MASWKKRSQMITTIKIMRMIIRRPCCYHLQTAAGLVTCVCLPFAHRQVKMTIFPFRHSTLYFPTFSQFGRAFNSSRTREKREKLRLILTSFFFCFKRFVAIFRKLTFDLKTLNNFLKKNGMTCKRRK